MHRSWHVVAVLCLVTSVAYLARTDIAVAQERMAPALGLSMADMGAITAWAFQLSYALLQLPCALAGERFGARRTLALALAGTSLASIVTGLMPESIATGTLIATRILLGVSQAAIFPVVALAVSQFVAREQRVGAMAMAISAASLGAAIAPLLMAPVMESYGWRTVFVVSGVLGTAAAIACAVMMPGAKARNDTVRVQRLADLLDGTRTLLRNASLRWLALAYLLHSAVLFVFIFWFFRYLTEGRGFTVLASGVWASLPNIAGVVCAPIIGAGADRLGRRIGSARARRRVAMACLVGVAVSALVGAIAPGAVLAILALSLSSGFVNGAESPFFTTATALGSANPGAAAGLLNLMGNLGGVLSIWLVPRMADAWGWNATIGFWAAVAFTAALLWLLVRETEPTPAGSVRSAGGEAAGAEAISPSAA